LGLRVSPGSPVRFSTALPVLTRAARVLALSPRQPVLCELRTGVLAARGCAARHLVVQFVEPASRIAEARRLGSGLAPKRAPCLLERAVHALGVALLPCVGCASQCPRRLRCLLGEPLRSASQRLPDLGRWKPFPSIVAVQPFERSIEPFDRSLESVPGGLTLCATLFDQSALFRAFFLGSRGVPVRLLPRDPERLHLPLLRFLLELRGPVRVLVRARSRFAPRLHGRAGALPCIEQPS
jgi:hypothetical protein